MRTKQENLELQARLQQFETKGKVASKNSHWIGKCITAFQWFLTFLVSLIARKPKQTWAQVRDDTAITIGHLVLVPDSWSVSSVQSVLPHEGRHIRQLTWISCGIHPMLGLPIGLLVYVLLPLPMGLDFGRALMELDAESTEQAVAVKEGRSNPDTAHMYMVDFAEQVGSLKPPYFLAIPKSWSKKIGLKMLERKLA